MLKVLFDTQIFDWQINGGISRYFIELLLRLEQSSETDVLFKCRHSYNTYIQGTQWLVNNPVLKDLHFKGKLSALKIINQKVNRPFSNRLLKKGIPDIFHPTYYDPYFLSCLGKIPLVLTVHDLTNEKFPDSSALANSVLAWKKQLIKRADHIIAVSDNTKKDIIDYYHVPSEKITRAYLASPFRKSDDTGFVHESQLSKRSLPYLLFVGSRQGYKNFNSFIREIAFVLLNENIQLIVAGGGSLNASEISLLKENGVYERVTALSHISDIHLKELYSKALLFIFPSLYEGFGIPVLEAMQCGCPVLLSDNSSLPEIGGDAALYFNPLKPGDMRTKLLEIIADGTRRKEMIIAGRLQTEKFSWDNNAIIHQQVYNRVLDN